MSLLTIIQTALREIGSIEVPTTVVGNQNETAINSLALTNRALRETAKRTKWELLTREATINTVASQAEYDLPSDFKSIHNQTMWNISQRRPTLAVTPQTWSFLQAFTDVSGIILHYRIFRDPAGNGQKVQFFPTPGAGQIITYEYVSNGLVQSSGGVLQEEFLADTDTALLDEDTILLGFKWRFLASKGFPYAEAFTDHEKSIAKDVDDTPSQIVNMGGGNRRLRTVLIVPDSIVGL